MESFIVPSIFIAAGLCLMFFGRKQFWLFVVVTSLNLLIVNGRLWLPWWALLFGGGCLVIGAMVWGKRAVFSLIALPGILAAAALLPKFPPLDTVMLYVVSTLAVFLAVLVWVKYDWALILISAVGGLLTALWGVFWLLDRNHYSESMHLNIWGTALIFGAFVLGIFVQAQGMRRGPASLNASKAPSESTSHGDSAFALKGHDQRMAEFEAELRQEELEASLR